MESSFSSSGDADGPAQPEIGRRIRLSGDGRDAARAKARPLGEAASIVSAMRRVNAEQPAAVGASPNSSILTFFLRSCFVQAATEWAVWQGLATMREKSQAHSESIVLRNVLAGLVLETKLIRLQRQFQAKGWETQPRAPAGQPNGGEWVQGPGGGQWASLHEDRPGGPSPQDPPALTDSTTLEDGTRVLSIRVHAGRKSFDEQHTVTAPDGESRIFETSGATQTILDGQTGDGLSRSTFTATDFVSEPLVQPAFLPAVPLAIEGALAAIQSARTLELALSLLTVLSARKNGFGAVLGLTAHEYALDASSQANMAIWVGPIGQQALDGACPRNGEVRAMTNEVAKTVRASGNYRNATDFGNKVHIEIARRMNLQADQDFKA
ncbi:hypothetical protein [Methylobacterium sp. GXF4]|uniref:hypothetical protein n=1 Tax=Methylobacterium sp. GXF4 TaxID=1096546 RepID=UPI000FFF6712|nr:hypothetical protein [Methylobacterium sp. GXF4]